MPRVYPPIWCKGEDCKTCDFIECDSKILRLLRPYEYPSLGFHRRRKKVEITSIAIYFGFCQRLSKFFLLFPQDSPISVVTENFLDSNTGRPATVSIQRVLLDMLNHGDPQAPTDDVHRLRLMFFTKATNRYREGIISAEKEVTVSLSEARVEDFLEKAKKLHHDLCEGKISSFEKTEDLNRCRYCFLENCEEYR